MSDNYFVWGTVAEFIASYKMMDTDGNIVPDVESQEIVKRTLTALRKFYADNGLLKVTAFDSKGELIDREYYANDFTDEGAELRKRKVPAWLKSKASKSDPPDMKLLEKALAEIRAGK
ncbi:hypothetical protein [Burkholderia diffusa]|uniref:hypothetical protein n=1 Tax=Burkholderia diffusa TaxID=488732 RepID=UPI00158E86D4|nr:hypothetical protein [Burkholderia diffusa]